LSYWVAGRYQLSSILQRFRKNYFDPQNAALHNVFSGLETIQINARLSAMDKPQDQRPTLKSLADITGLGVSTVSQALRNSPTIAEETRRRVQLAAQQAGYRPNRAGVRLRTGKTNVITVVLNPQDEGSGFFSQFVYGVSDALASTGYHLVITPYDLNDPMRPIRYIVETSSADGVILSRTQAQDARVRYLKENHLPFATHGRTDMGVAHAFHDFDNEAFAYEGVRRLAARGRKRVGLITPPPDLFYYIHTHRGFERGLKDFGLEAFPLGSCNTDSPLAELESFGRALAKHPQRPDGIISSATASAYAMSAGLQQQGLRLGNDFDTVSKHASNLLGIAMPDIISLPEDFHLAGLRTAQLLMREINGDDPSSLQEVVGLA
jgi:LacI family transcriptional regulator